MMANAYDNQFSGPYGTKPRSKWMPRRHTWILYYLGTLFASATGHAQTEAPPPSVSAESSTQLNDAGFELYHAGDYRHALEKFLEAYAVEHTPALLFNVARTYEALGESDAAIEKYEAFMLQSDDASAKARAGAAVDRLRERQRISSAKPTSTYAPPATHHTSGQSSSPQADPLPAPQTNESSSRHQTWPILALGTGAVVLGVGAIFYVLGLRDHQRVTDSFEASSSTLTRRDANNFVTSGNRKKALGGVGLGLGGALAATGTLLLLSGGSEHDDEQDAQQQGGVTLGVALLPGMGAMNLSGRF